MSGLEVNPAGAIWWLLMLGLWAVCFFDDAARVWDQRRRRRSR